MACVTCLWHNKRMSVDHAGLERPGIPPYKERVAVTSNIFQAALEMLDRGGQAALVSILSAEGFVPVSAAGKLLVTSAGTILGRSGSDVLDKDIRAEALRVMAAGIDCPRQRRVLEKDAVASG